MLANGDTACSPFAAPEPILHQVNFTARWRDFQSEAGKLPVPKIAIRLAGFGGIYRPFGDAGSNQSYFPCGAPRANVETPTALPVSTTMANSKNSGETHGMKTP
jgi:hypothetical protein